MLHLSIVIAGTDRETNGLGYYGLSADERAAFRARLGRRKARLRPILALVERVAKFRFEQASFEAGGIHGPRGTCGPDSFEAAFGYEPRSGDVFVATQMKCGTTWMQHVVYEILSRGDGDLVESGTALYAVSPWLEATKSVSVEDAPAIGLERPSRIIKTHLPARLCPRSETARYVYVARHPGSCFASCADFIATNTGPLQPPLADIEAWYCSDDMWWTPWPDHVADWWDRSRADGNVLFIHFEDMKRDLPGVAHRVSDFLGLAPLSGVELGRVVERCGFDYMKRHSDAFEMHPPHLFSIEGRFFVRGTEDRHGDVPADVAERIAGWCRDRLAGRAYPVERHYPDVARATGGDAAGGTARLDAAGAGSPGSPDPPDPADPVDPPDPADPADPADDPRA